MKSLRYFAFACLLAVVTHAAPLKDNIESEAIIVTKAELRRHMVAPEDDAFRPATYADLASSSGAAQPDYLVVRFRTKVPGHYSGEAEAKIDGALHGTKLNVVLHFNHGWVEYFIPLDGLAWPMRKAGGPSVEVVWNSLQAK